MGFSPSAMNEFTERIGPFEDFNASLFSLYYILLYCKHWIRLDQEGRIKSYLGGSIYSILGLVKDDGLLADLELEVP